MPNTNQSFIARFRRTLVERGLLCVGIDPEIEKLPAGLPRDLDGLVRFCEEIISATSAFAAAFKINFAFFEAHGQRGWAALERVAAAIPEAALKIADAKRGDIGNTARLYAQAMFQALPFDAMTASAYLGEDSAAPLLQNESKGVFFLCRTSNPSGSSIQCYPQQEATKASSSSVAPLYLHLAKEIASWNRYHNTGLVVGATNPIELERVREACPNLPMLIPGIGAQGGDLQTAVRFGATSSGDLGLINVSRAILYASSDSDFAEVAAARAKELQSEMARLIPRL